MVKILSIDILCYIICTQNLHSTFKYADALCGSPIPLDTSQVYCPESSALTGFIIREPSLRIVTRVSRADTSRTKAPSLNQRTVTFPGIAFASQAN